MRLRGAGLCVVPLVAACVSAAFLSACGGSPTNPGPVNEPPPPPANNAPVIQSITIQGTRSRQPANFADLNETINVEASVRDDETALDRLQYNWSAPVGTFNGSGARVTWQAPAQMSGGATEVAIRLEVVERYGTGQSLEHRVSSSANLVLHDSIKEVGDMARQFLLDFSDSSMRDVNQVMRNFNKSRCPEPGEVDAERDDVTRNRRENQIVNSRIGTPNVTINFGGTCPFQFTRGDACAVISAFWDSIDLTKNVRGTVEGLDIVAAAYSTADARWWLCSSRFEPRVTTGAIIQIMR
jgi:hypothetical protein